jgi:hypothetical protein
MIMTRSATLTTARYLSNTVQGIELNSVQIIEQVIATVKGTPDNRCL